MIAAQSLVLPEKVAAGLKDIVNRAPLMRERVLPFGGTCEITGVPGKGTTIRIVVAIPPQQDGLGTNIRGARID